MMTPVRHPDDIRMTPRWCQDDRNLRDHNDPLQIPPKTLDIRVRIKPHTTQLSYSRESSHPYFPEPSDKDQGQQPIKFIAPLYGLLKMMPPKDTWMEDDITNRMMPGWLLDDTKVTQWKSSIWQDDVRMASHYYLWLARWWNDNTRIDTRHS